MLSPISKYELASAPHSKRQWAISRASRAPWQPLPTHHREWSQFTTSEGPQSGMMGRIIPELWLTFQQPSWFSLFQNCVTKMRLIGQTSQRPPSRFPLMLIRCTQGLWHELWLQLCLTVTSTISLYGLKSHSDSVQLQNYLRSQILVRTVSSPQFNRTCKIAQPMTKAQTCFWLGSPKCTP